MSGHRKSKTPWFFAGLSLGVLAGVLCAPKSGRETRAAIAAGVEDGRKYIISLERDARRHISNVADSGKKILGRQKERIAAWVKRTRKTLKHAA